VSDGIDPIDDEELLYRRVPASTGWYDSASGEIDELAFQPNKTVDVTGLSFAREKYKTIEEAARGRPGKSYFVAVFRAGALRTSGINIEPRPNTPDGFDPAHAELPQLNAASRGTNQCLDRQRVLAKELCLRVEGPFVTS